MCEKAYQCRKIRKGGSRGSSDISKMFLESRDIIRSRNGNIEISKKRMVLEKEIRDLGQKEVQLQQKLSSSYLDYKDKLLTVQEYFMLKEEYQRALAQTDEVRKEKELLLHEMQETYGDNLELSQAAEQYAGQDTVT